MVDLAKRRSEALWREASLTSRGEDTHENMKSKVRVLITVLGMFLVGVWATSAQMSTKTETITRYDVELEAVKTAENLAPVTFQLTVC